MSISQNILEILKTEPIRMIDGRYSTGFVDTDVLAGFITAGQIEIYKIQGMQFVRLPVQTKKNKKQKHK